MLEKINVNGPAAHPIFKYLRQNTELQGADVPHNFTKFVVVPDGPSEHLKFYKPGIQPLDVLKDIIGILG